MQLTPQGTQLTALGRVAKRNAAIRLLRGQDHIHQFVQGGVCYDVAGFVKYLIIGDQLPQPSQPDLHVISTADLLSMTQAQWRINLSSSVLWQAGQHIAPGSVLAFFRERDSVLFHFAVATGGTKLRAENGGLLGAGWLVPADLSEVLTPIAGNPGRFSYDGGTIRVQVQTTAIGFDLV
jgi:hypothetical protein